MRFYIETFGCTANQGNSIQARSELMKLGHMPSSLEEASLVIVNTCAVTEKTQRKIVRRLRQLQGRRLVIAGCLPASIPGSLEGISCLKALGVLHRSDIGSILDALSTDERSTDERSTDDRSAAEMHGDRKAEACRAIEHEANACGIINISEGCMGKCSYCIVRKARGSLKSMPLEEVLELARSLLASGAVEIQLASQDAAAYGQDIGTSLPELIGEISKIPGRHKVRVGMMNPDTAMPLLGDLIEAFKSPRVYKFLHMPLQSGSDSVLEEMARNYSASDFENAISRFREAFKEIFIATDVIAGFPGESEKDFESTYSLIKRIEPDKVNVTRFSSRPGTQASKLYDMPDRFKKERSRKITKLWIETASMRNRRYEGSILDVLVTERGRGKTMKARSSNYSGVVVTGEPPLGSDIRVKVAGSNPFYLIGTALTGHRSIATPEHEPGKMTNK